MASKENISNLVESMKGLTRDELIIQIQAWVPHSDRHIAAKICLDKLDQRDEETRHEATIAAAKKSNWLSTIAIVVAVLSLIVAIAAWLKN